MNFEGFSGTIRKGAEVGTMGTPSVNEGIIIYSQRANDFPNGGKGLVLYNLHVAKEKLGTTSFLFALVQIFHSVNLQIIL